ncbi:MAG: hypothetical protein ACD_28C00113G0005 [uncultured bacterium]|nr:MAG: hypothetical protein ACD_28C00113G0005 [uncultured bacterium]
MNKPPFCLRWATWMIVGLLAFPSLALAHPGHGIANFASGFLHPFSGLDHLLAMIAVGLWAVQSKGKALWGLPLAFIGSMTMGGMLSFADIQLAGVESMIISSSLILGLLVTKKTKISPWTGMGIVSFFALFHGYAHGAELGVQTLTSTTAGFVLSTALLHLAGIGLGLIGKQWNEKTIQWAGVATSMASVGIVFGLF